MLAVSNLFLRELTLSVVALVLDIFLSGNSEKTTVDHLRVLATSSLASTTFLSSASNFSLPGKGISQFESRRLENFLGKRSAKFASILDFAASLILSISERSLLLAITETKAVGLQAEDNLI